MKKLCSVLGCFLLLTACAVEKELNDMPVGDLYNEAFEDLEATRYKSAAAKFEKVETEHPYSKWAVKAKLMGAYAYYKDEKYDDAVLALDRFIKYHPGNRDVAYAYYMKGICYYDQISSADKDQGNTEKAEEAFSRLIALFPNSKYADDARQKIKLTEDYRAGQEMIIGRYYLNEGNYLSALNRFNVVLENYQTTIQIEESLYRQVEIYAIFGMNKYADGYYKILKNNYPDGVWTQKAAAVMEKINAVDKKENNPVKVADEKSVSAKVEDDKDGGWFDWFKFGFGEEKGVDAKAEINEDDDDSGTLFGWWHNRKNAVAESEKSVAIEKTSEATQSSAKQISASDKDSVGDIIAAHKKEAQ